MLNEQKALPRYVSQDGELEIHSLFLTIQGEGPFAGERAFFVRLFGCNLECQLCDTDYTSKNNLMRALDIVEHITHELPRNGLIVLTGGEPMRQNIGPFVTHALAAGYRLQIETNGVLCAERLPWHNPNFSVVVSPKTHKIHRKVKEWAVAFKYVGRFDNLCEDDGLPRDALKQPLKPGTRLARPRDGAPVFLQPVDEQDEDANKNNLDAVIASCINHGHRLCLQMHKIIGLE